ncbi:MAG: hypothetical protein ACW968_01245 [Candidatus Thorarchaeota archaeon]|jgi:hypothetical protein
MSSRAMGLMIQIMMLLIIFLMIGMVLSWTILDPNLTWDQRLIGGGLAVVMIAILLGVTVQCVFKGGRIRIG